MAAALFFSSATLPDFSRDMGRLESRLTGIPAPYAIIHEPEKLAKRLNRTHFVMRGKLDFDAVAAELDATAGGQVLCIVNTKRHCREVFDRVASTDKIHLSAAMCPADRSMVLEKIRRWLKAGKPVIAVATTLVEAGVDIDFPVVWREMAGLDSLAQVAGRCNREGKRPESPVFLFEPLSERMPKQVRSGVDAARETLYPENCFVASPAIFRKYFDAYFRRFDNLDAAHFQERLCSGVKHLDFEFSAFAGDFRMIDDTWYAPVIVRYGESPG